MALLLAPLPAALPYTASRSGAVFIMRVFDAAILSGGAQS